MNWKKRFALLFGAVVMAGALTACGSSEDKEETSDSGKKVLTMGTSADYPPFEYVETATGDEIKGFDVDIAKAIGDKLGYEIKVKDMDFNGLVTGLENNQVDFVLAGMTPTPDRKKSVDFSDIYYESKNMIVSKKDSGIKSASDLAGKKVGVQLSSIQDEWAQSMIKDKNIKMKVQKLNRIPEIVQEIVSGRFDAAIIEDTVAKGYLEDNKDLTGLEIKDNEEAGSAIAFKKGSSLTKEFNKALNEMKENGEVDKLILKWFDEEEK